MCILGSNQDTKRWIKNVYLCVCQLYRVREIYSLKDGRNRLENIPWEWVGTGGTLSSFCSEYSGAVDRFHDLNIGS